MAELHHTFCSISANSSLSWYPCTWYRQWGENFLMQGKNTEMLTTGTEFVKPSKENCFPSFAYKTLSINLSIGSPRFKRGTWWIWPLVWTNDIRSKTSPSVNPLTLWFLPPKYVLITRQQRIRSLSKHAEWACYNELDQRYTQLASEIEEKHWNFLLKKITFSARSVGDCKVKKTTQKKKARKIKSKTPPKIFSFTFVEHDPTRVSF